MYDVVVEKILVCLPELNILSRREQGFLHDNSDKICECFCKPL